LLIQLTPETPHRETLRVLIQNHLEDIAHNRLPIIQRRTGFDLATIKEAIEILKHLNPHPGAQFTAENIPYVVPDIAVERDEDSDYKIRLLDDWMPNIYISRRYMELYRDKAADPKAKEYLKRKIQAAQWLLESIEQRRNTLEKVTRAIIQHQRAFLDQGPDHIQPLKMQQIADQVGVHVTTVSRAVDDKWVQTPRGIFPPSASLAAAPRRLPAKRWPGSKSSASWKRSSTRRINPIRFRTRISSPSSKRAASRLRAAP